MSDYNKLNYLQNKRQNEVNRLKVNHVLHVIICVFTFGLWIVVWFVLCTIAQHKIYNVNLKYNCLEKKLM